MLTINLLGSHRPQPRARVSRLVWVIPPLTLLLCACVLLAGWLGQQDDAAQLDAVRSELQQLRSQAREQALAPPASEPSGTDELIAQLAELRRNDDLLPPLVGSLLAGLSPADRLVPPTQVEEDDEGGASEAWAASRLRSFELRLREHGLEATGLAASADDLVELLSRFGAVGGVADARFTRLAIGEDTDAENPLIAFTLRADVLTPERR